MRDNDKGRCWRPPVEDWALYWFEVLVSSDERGNFEAAANAQKELRRLGYEVRRVARREAAAV